MLFIFSTPALNRRLWQLKMVVFLHWHRICTVLLWPIFQMRFRLRQWFCNRKVLLLSTECSTIITLPEHLKHFPKKSFEQKSLFHPHGLVPRFQRKKNPLNPQNFISTPFQIFWIWAQSHKTFPFVDWTVKLAVLLLTSI